MLDAPVAQAPLARGIAVASINYRLSSEAKFPAALDDARLAVRFLRANASEYRLDPARVLVFGQSAGGNLASMLGLTLVGDEALVGVVDWFGPADFASLDADAKAQGCPADHGAADSPESAYLGKPVGDAPELANAASPLQHIHAAAPPFLLQKGAQDCLIPVAQSQKFQAALREAGVEAALDILPGAGHGDMGLSKPVFASPSNVERVLVFMAEKLKQP
jgi:acetyl esterase/lipase